MWERGLDEGELLGSWHLVQCWQKSFKWWKGTGWGESFSHCHCLPPPIFFVPAKSHIQHSAEEKSTWEDTDSGKEAAKKRFSYPAPLLA